MKEDEVPVLFEEIPQEFIEVFDGHQLFLGKWVVADDDSSSVGPIVAYKTGGHGFSRRVAIMPTNKWKEGGGPCETWSVGTGHTSVTLRVWSQIQSNRRVAGCCGDAVFHKGDRCYDTHYGEVVTVFGRRDSRKGCLQIFRPRNPGEYKASLEQVPMDRLINLTTGQGMLENIRLLYGKDPLPQDPNGQLLFW